MEFSFADSLELDGALGDDDDDDEDDGDDGGGGAYCYLTMIRELCYYINFQYSCNFYKIVVSFKTFLFVRTFDSF
jgi:hypothetical protein